MTPTQNIAMTLEGELLKQLSGSVLEKAADAVRKEAVNIVKERTLEGYDLNGRKFGNYNTKTYKTKKGIRLNKEQYIDFKRRKYGHVDYLYNSGDLFRGITTSKALISRTGKRIMIRFNMTVTATEAEKAEGLMSTRGVARNRKSYSKKAWLFLGISEQGGRYQIERNRLIRVFSNAIKSNVTGRITATH